MNEVLFARSEIGGAFTWDELARYRDIWKGPLVIKGIMHPADAERRVSLGIDGVWVSNHGGRQIEALPAPIDVLPAIAARSAAAPPSCSIRACAAALDVVRAVALGAHAAFAGKALLWGLGALGGRGRPRHRSHDRRDELGVRPDRRHDAGRRALGGDPPSGRLAFPDLRAWPQVAMSS